MAERVPEHWDEFFLQLESAVASGVFRALRAIHFKGAPVPVFTPRSKTYRHASAPDVYEDPDMPEEFAAALAAMDAELRYH